MDTEIVEAWREVNLAKFVDFAGRVDGENKNVLVAALRRGLTSRAIEIWRKEYGALNPLARLLAVRLRSVARASDRLVTRHGSVALAGREATAGDLSRVPFERIALPPQPRVVRKRRRLPRNASADYERWMVECLRVARGAVRLRQLAEALAEQFGELVRYPGQVDELPYGAELVSNELYDPHDGEDFD